MRTEAGLQGPRRDFSSSKISALIAQHSVLCAALCALLFALCLRAEAQQPTKIPRIGFLLAVPASTISARLEAFRHGLRELGYVEGKNIIIEWRSTEGKADRLPTLAAELVRLKVDVIVSGGPPPTRSAKQATSTIPIVMGYDDDPVGSGFVASLAHPGGNITGLATLAPEISGKQMELLKEIIPRFSRVAVIGSSSQPSQPQALREINLAADAFGVKVHYLETREAKDIEAAFEAAIKAHADAVLVVTTPVLTSRAKALDRPRNEEPVTDNFWQAGICRRRRTRVLRRELYRLVPPRRRLRRQNFQRRKTGRSARGTTNEIRARDQS